MGAKPWKREVKEHINNELINDLHEALALAQDAEGKELNTRRKDMVGLSGFVDRRLRAKDCMTGVCQVL